MHFNNDEIAAFAESAGDHEGRLTHKPPPRTLYDSAYKERWFKLKANLLFYYRLNEFGGIGKNEPSGVFVLENIEVQKEGASDVPFGFAIKWKDDMDRKHLFFAQSEASAVTWVNKLIHASYEHMRAQMVMLRVQIRRKTGKDPLEHFGTPLIQRTSRIRAKGKSQFHVDLEEEEGHASQNLPLNSMARLLVQRSPEGKCHSIHGLPSMNSTTKVEISKSPSLREPSLREPVRAAPLPPPRKGRKQNAGNGHTVVDDLVLGIGSDQVLIATGRDQSSFKCHIEDDCLSSKQTNLLD